MDKEIVEVKNVKITLDRFPNIIVYMLGKKTQGIHPTFGNYFIRKNKAIKK
jgi:hypothetical protein